MKHLSAADRKTFAEQLQAMKRSALEEIRSTSADVENSLQPASHEVQSHVDEAEVERVGEVRFAEIEIDRARLHDIELAQQRITEGRYGVCMDCSEVIPRERLLAQPTAIRCAGCQIAAESRQRR